jgi:hypothetical protein
MCHDYSIIYIFMADGSHSVTDYPLLLQVSALKAELEVTHSHYQKLLEQVAGPGWSRDMGPMERDESEGSGGKGIAGGGERCPPEGSKSDSKRSSIADGMGPGRPQVSGGAGAGPSSRDEAVSVGGCLVALFHMTSSLPHYLPVTMSRAVVSEQRMHHAFTLADCVSELRPTCGSASSKPS